MTTYELKPITAAELGGFLTDEQRYFYQMTPEFGEVHKALGTRFEWLGLFADGALRAVAKVLYYRYRRWFFSADVPFGPIFNHDEPELFGAFLTQLTTYLARNSKVLRVRICPLLVRRSFTDFADPVEQEDAGLWSQALGEAGFRELPGDCFSDGSLNGRFFYGKDIEGLTEEAFWASCQQSARYSLSLAEKWDVKVRNLKAEEYPIFERLMEETVARTGMGRANIVSFNKQAMELYPDCAFPVAYLDCRESLEKLESIRDGWQAELDALQAKLDAGQLNPKKARGQINDKQQMLDANNKRIAKLSEIREKHGDTVYLAASAFFFTPSDCIYLESAAYEEFLSLCPVYAIHRQMVREALSRGCRRYNFFVVSGAPREDAPDLGVLEFKQKFSGNMEELFGTWERVLRPGLDGFFGKLLGR